MRVVPPGATSPRRSAHRQATCAAADAPRFLCVGNWVERKGILSLLEAFATLDDDAATLHLVGDTQAEPAYARRVWARLAQPDLAARVVVHGPLVVGDVAAMYAAADAFVLPSLKEPYGTVYGEAMAFGLPVVGWRAGNLPYLADHEREGLLVDARRPGGPGARAAAPGGRRRAAPRLGAAARQRALNRPTWDDVGAHVLRSTA